MKTLEAPLTTICTEAAEAPPIAVGVTRPIWTDYLTLAKPRIALLALFTVMVGYLLGAGNAPIGIVLLHTLLATGLVAAGAGALNHYWERDLDGLMERTSERPIPAGRVSPGAALRFGVFSGSLGLVYLTVAVNPLAATVAFGTLAIYVFVYTPLKRITTLNTLIGAVPGALPPVIGWAAATGSLGSEAFVLFLILFVWQLPHFWAIAWLCRQDYAQAGLKMLPVMDQTGGRMTGRMMVQHCGLLLLAALGPFVFGMAGLVYLVSSIVLGLGFMYAALRFAIRPGRRAARHVMWASLVYLPVLLTVLLMN